MTAKLTRREVIARSLVAAPGLLYGLRSTAFAADVDTRLADLEKKSGGRLGVAFLEVASGRRVERRAHERFPMCSTFKWLAAAFVLSRVDRGEERLDRRITFTKADLVPYSPVTEKRTGPPGMTLEELCDAAVTVSDNTAGNLLLASFGGPAGLTKHARSLGDKDTRLDRNEPGLNEATPGDVRDTTTPAAMTENVRRLVLGDALSAASRTKLTDWLAANTTGDSRLRAGFPRGWKIGDKTGSGSHGVTNDVAIAWPPERPPVIVSAYFAESAADGDARNAVLAEVARIVAGGVSHS